MICGYVREIYIKTGKPWGRVGLDRCQMDIALGLRDKVHYYVWSPGTIIGCQTVSQFIDAGCKIKTRSGYY